MPKEKKSASVAISLAVHGDLLVGEEHEMLDQDFRRLFQGLFRVDRSVGRDLQVQLFVAGLTIKFCKIPPASLIIPAISSISVISY